MSTKKIIFIFFAIIVLVISYIGYNLFSALDKNKVIQKLNNTDCTKISIDNNGPEDIDYFNEDYLITAAGNYQEVVLYSNPVIGEIKSGAIYLISKKTNDLIKLRFINFPEDTKFIPHGIYKKDEATLYVVNHAYSHGGERVDQFLIDDKEMTATYVRSLKFPPSFIGTINDIIVLEDNDTVIATVWQIFKHGINGPNHLLGKFATLITLGLNLELTDVWACSISLNDCKVLENTQGKMNNGITWNRKDRVFIADSINQTMREFRLVHPKNYIYDNIKLELIKTVKLGYAVDNVTYNDEENRVYASLIGRVVDHLELMEYAHSKNSLPEIKDKNNKSDFMFYSGSSVYDLNSSKYEILHFNSQIIGGSSSIMDNNKIYYGSFCDKIILVCTVN